MLRASYRKQKILLGSGQSHAKFRWSRISQKSHLLHPMTMVGIFSVCSDYMLGYTTVTGPVLLKPRASQSIKFFIWADWCYTMVWYAPVVNVIVFVVALLLLPLSLAIVRLSSSLSRHYRCRCLPSRQCHHIIAMTLLSSLFSPCHYCRHCVPCHHCRCARSPRPVVENFAKQPVNLKCAPLPIIPSITGDIPATDSQGWL